MANIFDPLKTTVGKEDKDINNRSSFTCNNASCTKILEGWVRQTSSDTNELVYSAGAQQYQTASNKLFNVSNGTTKLGYGQNNPASKNPQKSSSGDLASQSLRAHIVEQQTKPYWETGDDSYQDYDYDPSAANQYNEYDSTQSASYEEDEHDYKKKISAKIDRLVQRFPILNKFYKQPMSKPALYSPSENFQPDSISASIGSNPFKYELNTEDLALKERYSDKMRTKVVKLQAKDQTQPVDITINPATNKIYLCDVGRSIVEIFEMNGTFEHSIHDSTMSKFQPTAIDVTFDGTIIVASHFNHCLHMHSPNTSDIHSYKRFKLGTEGDQIHQFYHPAGIAIDKRDGSLYVCDRGNNRIQVISPEGLCVRLIQLFLYGHKDYALEPIRIAHQQNTGQILCITGVGDLLCFIPKDADGAVYVTPLAITDSNGLGVENASGLAVDSHDRIFISDTGHHRIVVCTPDGSYLTSFGVEGDGPGQLKRPCGLDITTDGTVIVTDPGNKRIQFFGILPAKTQDETNLLNGSSNQNDNLHVDSKHSSVAYL